MSVQDLAKLPLADRVNYFLARPLPSIPGQPDPDPQRMAEFRARTVADAARRDAEQTSRAS